MSKSFLEAMRTAVGPRETICSIGFDPDLHTSGIGILIGSLTRPPVAEPTFVEVWAIMIYGREGSLQDVQFADSMVTEVLAFFDGLPNMSLAPSEKVITTVEGQRIYPKPNDTRQALVGKANDLMRLGQVSGAVQGRTRSAPYDGSRVYLPEEWKGQAPKATMHQDTAKRLGDIPARLIGVKPGGKVTVDRSLRAMDLGNVPKAFGHALDAVCLAEFGLDRYHDDRWSYRW